LVVGGSWWETERRAPQKSREVTRLHEERRAARRSTLIIGLHKCELTAVAHQPDHGFTESFQPLGYQPEFLTRQFVCSIIATRTS
jgi:hypothetical protein